MNVTYESGITDYRNKDVLQIGFAKYKQMGSQFAEFEKELQNGWFLLPVGDDDLPPFYVPRGILV